MTDDYDESAKYSQPLVSIKQISITSESDTIDLTPHDLVPMSHDYSNVSPDGLIDGRPIKPPRPPLVANKPTVRTGQSGSSHQLLLYNHYLH